MTIAFILIVIHYIADFIFQDEKWALGKSKNWSDLLSHTITYSLIFIFPCYFIFDHDLLKAFCFFGITFLCHTITDYFTSRWVAKKFAANHYGSAVPNFGAFSSIGLDQVLHYAQLFLTYHLLVS